MIPGHLPQAWRKPRGVPIVDTQFSFGDEEGGGGDEVVVFSFFLSLRLRMEFSSFSSLISCSSSNTFLHQSCLFSCKRRKGVNWILGFFALLGRLGLLLPFRIVVFFFLRSPAIVFQIHINLGVCDIINNIALTLRVLG